MYPFQKTLVFALFLIVSSAAVGDWRSLSNGRLILEDAYLDQTNLALVKLPSNNSTRWILTLTRNTEGEGSRGENVIVMYSDDHGVTFSSPARLEPNTTLTNAYSSIVVTNYTRVYVSYNMNVHNVSTFPDGKSFVRDDTLGEYVMRWSDDCGETWSPERLQMPLRTTEIDANNAPFKGSVKMFWNVDQYKTRGGAAYIGFTKVGTYGYLPPEEGFLWYSPNLLTERNTSAIQWEEYPTGEHGFQVPGGNREEDSIEEIHVVPLMTQQSGGGVFAVFRTSLGRLGCTATKDATGATGWVPTTFASFWDETPSAKAVNATLRNPRGPITLKRLQLPFAQGRYLLLWYNNGNTGYNNRNPYWLSSGVETREGDVRFSQPEIVLYDFMDQAANRVGYPDFVEDPVTSAVYIVETNKSMARVHPLPTEFVQMLLFQDSLRTVAVRGLVLTFHASDIGKVFPTPPLSVSDGWSVEIFLDHIPHTQNSTATILDTKSMLISVAGSGALRLVLNADSGYQFVWTMDTTCASLLNITPGKAFHVVAIIVDAAAHIVLSMVDGFLCDGGEERASGWAWLPADLSTFVNTTNATFRWATDLDSVQGGRWYDRALAVTEAVGNYRGSVEGLY